MLARWVLIPGFVLMLSCARDRALENTRSVDCSEVSYTSDVRPVIDNNCSTTGCHDAITIANGIDLTTYDNIKVRAADPQFLLSIKHGPGVVPMPYQSPKLNLQDIETIECWIESGMLQN